MRLGRRGFFRASTALAAGYGLPLLYSRPARAAGYGQLVPDPDGVVDLPPGFVYGILEKRGDPMSDGLHVPARPDAMGCFEGPDGTLVLMRNHETATSVLESAFAIGQSLPPETYTPNSYGGVTRLVVSSTTFARISSNLVLTGTRGNCAGGVSPWGWLSCEENVDAQHGYTFLCPTDADAVRPAERITGYGRYNHEAACVDPATSIAYLTEDRGDSCFYRFVPTDPQKPFEGQLQALKIVAQTGFDTGAAMSVGEKLDVEWVDVDEVDPTDDTLRVEAQSKGAAIFRRGEGIWFDSGAVYICSTSGGPVGGGQIFRFVPDASQTGGALELVAQSTDLNVLDHPDNITVAPWGDIFVAEDGDGDNYIRGIAADGSVFDFARNALSDSEFAGVCFSPDGRALFANIQADGLTLVIAGPFPGAPPLPDGGLGAGGTLGTAGTGGTAGASGSAASLGSGGTSPRSASQGSDDGGCGCSTPAGQLDSGVTAGLVSLGAAALAFRTRGPTGVTKK